MLRERYYADYVSTYLQKDVSDFAHVGKLHEFENFLVYMAAHTAQELKYSDIATSIGVSAPTAKEWVSILVRAGIIYLLRPYFNNITKRLVKTPKMYFIDTGLAAYLCRWPSAETIENGAMDGAFFETWVISELLKSFYNAGKTPDLYYYRDIDKREIDLLMYDGTSLCPIEIKKNKMPRKAAKNFGALNAVAKDVGTGFIICMADELIPYSKDVYLCPASCL